MNRKFNEREVVILCRAAIEVDEVYVEQRHDLAMTKYIMLVKDVSVWDDDTQMPARIDPSLIGTWMMTYPADLRLETMDDCIESSEWVRCVKREITTHEWVRACE